MARKAIYIIGNVKAENEDCKNKKALGQIFGK